LICLVVVKFWQAEKYLPGRTDATLHSEFNFRFSSQEVQLHFDYTFP